MFMNQVLQNIYVWMCLSSFEDTHMFVLKGQLKGNPLFWGSVPKPTVLST